MKLIDLTCPKCGAEMQVNAELKNGMCNHCGYSFLIDDEIKRVSLIESEMAGYEFEQGRMRAQAEAEAKKEKKKHE